MKIYLLDRKTLMVDAWKDAFDGCDDVEVCLDDFKVFVDNTDVECIVSPANSYGMMDGGYDAAITEYFGYPLMEKAQKYIIDNFYGEQPVGTSFIIDIPGSDKKLIHTPSMRVPQRIKDPEIVYQCMRTTLMTALNNNIKSIVIPAFGGATGQVPVKTIATLMKLAYDRIKNPPEEIDWNWVTFPNSFLY